MKKSELSIEHIEKINFAVQKGLDTKNWEPVNLLSGGLTGVPVYRIEVENKSYAIKLENVDDKNFDLVRNYKIIETVSKQGISPFVYFTDPECGIILMQYVEPKPQPKATSETMKKIASVIRKLHENNSFSKWKSVLEVLDYFYQRLSPEYMLKNIIIKCMEGVKRFEKYLFRNRIYFTIIKRK